MAVKTHKRKKSSRQHGRNQGTHGWGARKKHKKSGHRGGKGMAGTGKRGDAKKTLITKLYGHSYWGKKGKRKQKNKPESINLRDILLKLETFMKKGVAKKTGDVFEINLENYKILSGGNLDKFKGKLIIKAKKASKLAIQKIEKAESKIMLPEFKEKEKIAKKSGDE